MCRCALLGLLAALILPGPAFALRHIIVGNQPLYPGPGFGKEFVAACNVDERVLLSEHEGSYTVYFQGGPKALNDAVRHFLAIPAGKHEIILLPGPAKPFQFDKKAYPYDWVLYAPAPPNERRRGRVGITATLTIYIPEPLPPAPADPKAARAWIADLGSDDFKVRERAARELAAGGPSVAGLLRDALRARPSADVRDRIEKLLAGMSREIRLDVLDLPAGVTLHCQDDFMARARQQLADKDPIQRGHGANGLVEHDPPAAEVLPELEKVLKTETDANPLAGAMWAANHLGAGAKPLLPAMRAAVPKVEKSLAASFQQVIDGVEAAKAEPVSKAELKKRATIRQEIKDYVAGRRTKD